LRTENDPKFGTICKCGLSPCIALDAYFSGMDAPHPGPLGLFLGLLCTLGGLYFDIVCLANFGCAGLAEHLIQLSQWPLL